MKNYITIYDTSTGIILRNVSGLSDITNNVKSGESYIEGIYSTDKFIVVDGVAVAKSSEVITQQNKTQAIIDLRSYRDVMLNSSDWTQTPDSPLSDTKKQEWQTYRQALRDLPTAYTDIESVDEVTWPTAPE
tara:strand:- start:273 stop:668 length:396 start_codon:yes stop_codon:yes gene_type:complete